MGEPNVVINGKLLTEAQAMTLRVAINSFLMEMENPDALGDDEHGKSMTSLYRLRLKEINDIIFSAKSSQSDGGATNGKVSFKVL